MKNVLHVIQQLSGGGASRFLLSAARLSTAAGQFRHSILSLLPCGPKVEALATEQGCELFAAPPAPQAPALVAAADVVQVHYWNTPELFRWIDDLHVEARILLFCHVGGGQPPQAVTRDLLAWPDLFVANGPHTAALPVVRDGDPGPRAEVAVVEAAADFGRIDGVKPRARQEFTVGTIGTIDFVKLHADFVPMNVAAGPDVRFVVCGSGAATQPLQRQATALGVADRFSWIPQTENVGDVFGSIDVFGYPLCPDNYSSAELVLQEAMAAGVPPVVLPWGGAACAVEHGETGLVAGTAEQYAPAIIYLRDHPDVRMRMSEAGKVYARRRWNLTRCAEELDELYQRLLVRPRRSRSFGERPRTGAAAFLRAQGENAPPHFRVSLLSRDVIATAEAEATIAGSSPLMRCATAGGILHYRRAYPDDADLALWAGLVLEAEGRRVLAAAEYDRARRLGCASPHVAEHFRRVRNSLASPSMKETA